MIPWLRRVWDSRGFRYLFFGGLTTLVNIACFWLLTKAAGWNVDAGNAVSIGVALIFAYVVNTWFVFRSKCSRAWDRVREFFRFAGARALTMVLEFLGVHFMVMVFLSVLSKMVIQVAVILLNYVFSRWIVYKGA